MAVAALLLGWRPGEFWAATPAELAAILDGMTDGAGDDARGMGAADLARLKEAWPDGG
ncbi:MAG TPA: phage tail assembly chaperone [Sphingobium sp.]